MKGLTLKELSLQGVHEDVCIGGGHLGAHCRSLYLLVDMCVKRENIAFENYVKECLHNISGQREKIPVFQRMKALRSAFVLWNIKVKGGYVYGS